MPQAELVTLWGGRRLGGERWMHFLAWGGGIFEG